MSMCPEEFCLRLNRVPQKILQNLTDKMTTSSENFIKSARYMIERYGDYALKEVDQRIAELHEHGQIEAYETWIEIRKAVLLLLDSSHNQTKH